MKRHLSLFLATCAFAVLAACQTPPAVGPSQPLTSQQIMDQAGQRLQQITLARQAATQLAVAGKVTWAQDDAAQAALTLIRQKLISAQGLSVSNPAQAAQLLAEALAALAAYQGAPK